MVYLITHCLNFDDASKHLAEELFKILSDYKMEKGIPSKQKDESESSPQLTMDVSSTTKPANPHLRWPYNKTHTEISIEIAWHEENEFGPLRTYLSELLPNYQWFLSM